METITPGSIVEHTIRFAIIMLGIGFAVALGRYRPEWKSRKTLISWVWTMVAVDIMIMNGEFSKSLSAQMFIAGALMLNIINFIGDRIETIKFKDFSASLKHEDENDQKHSMYKRPEPTPTPPKKEPVSYVTEDINEWPDGGTADPGPEEIKIVPPPQRKF
jgi:hypothetical protein